MVEKYSSTGTPTLSVIMGVYNEEKYIQEAIDSILGQTFGDFEFIIVDDNSQDESANLIESYDDSRIQFIKNKTNRGLTTSLNRALDHATGTYVARQDADDISEPKRFEKQISLLEQNTDVSLVGTGTYLINSDGEIVDKRLGYCNPTFDDFLDKSYLVHGSIIARRTVLEELGGYDEFFRYGQDYDLWLRLSKQYNVVNIPAPYYRHRIHNEGVYFSRKDESALYTMLARHLATNKTKQKTKDKLRESEILNYYNMLDNSQREAFHRSLAIRYLRYGHHKQAITECNKAANYKKTSIKLILVYLLALGGSKPTKLVRWLMRRYLNLKTNLHNLHSCPYNIE